MEVREGLLEKMALCGDQERPGKREEDTRLGATGKPKSTPRNGAGRDGGWGCDQECRNVRLDHRGWWSLLEDIGDFGHHQKGKDPRTVRKVTLTAWRRITSVQSAG